MHWLIAGWPHLGAVAVKAALMYATALFGLRVAVRRTLTQWSVTDFVVTVAVGAIVARTAIASDQAYVTGAVALVTLIVAHRLVALMRFQPGLERLLDHRVRVLVAHGEIRRGELRRCSVTLDDLYTELRQRGVFDVRDVRYVLYEPKGSITVVPEGAVDDHEPELVRVGIDDAAGYDERHL